MTHLLDIHGHFFNVLTQMYLICLSFGSKVCEVLINAANISYERLAELKNVGPENIQGEANPRQERKTKQAHPTVDQDENWQYYSVQRQEATLEENQAEAVDLS